MSKLYPGTTTNDYRNAPGGDDPLGATWKDKPHRLVYDLCSELERLNNGEWTAEWPTEVGSYWCYGYPHGKPRDGKPPTMQLCEVRPMSKGVCYVCNGAFVWPTEAGPIQFTPALIPAAPSLTI